MGEARRRKEMLPPPGKFQPRVSRREAMRAKAEREEREPVTYTEASREDREADVRAVSVALFWGVVMLVLTLLAAFTLYDKTH